MTDIEQQPPVTTTDFGIPAPSDEFSLSAGEEGPLLLQDHYLIQKMAQFNRERVPSGSCTRKAPAPTATSRSPRT